MSFTTHLVAELREGLGCYARTFVGTVALAALAGLVALVGIVLPDPGLAAGEKALALLVVPLYAALQGAWLGLFTGGFAVLFRVAGPAALLPVALGVAGAALAWSLGFGWVESAWAGLGTAIGDRAGELGGGGMGSCASPAVLVILVPLVLLHFLAAPQVLVALAAFVGVAVGLLGAGAAVGAGLALPPLLLAVAGRLRARAAAREAAAGAGASPPPPA